MRTSARRLHTLLNTRAVMPEGNGGRILVAEDEPLVLNVVSNVLVRFGYEVVRAGDGSSAYELFQQHACELVLLVVDIAMPKKSGVEMRAEEHTAELQSHA